MTVMIHLCAPNDRNGNPRRLFLELNECGCAVRHWLEGYKGSSCVPDGLRKAAAMAVRINVSASEWNSWRKACPEGEG
jgi:hypothetical protein